MLKLRKILLCDLLYYILVLIVIFYFVIVTKYFPKTSLYIGNESVITGIITNYQIDGDNLSLTINDKEKLIAKYYFKSEQEKNDWLNNIKLGIKIKVKGKLEKPINNTIPNTFNYKKYLNSHKIYWLMASDEVKIINNKYNIFYSVKNFMIKRINSLEKSSAYLKTFILGEKNDIEPGMYEYYQKNGVSHLFALSGMHVSLFTAFIILILKKLRIGENKRYLVAILFILFYAVLTNFTASILRAGLFFSLLSINKIFYTNVKVVNILLLTGVILILINPYILYDIGFQYSFVTSFGLVFSGSKISSKNYFPNLLKISLMAFLFSIPISLNNFFEINLLTIINNLIFVPLVTIIIYPLSLITFILPFLDSILYFFIKIMELINGYLGNLKMFFLIVPKLSFVLVLIYYFLLIITLIKNKSIFKIALVMMLLINKYKCKFDPSAYVYFLDVGQGDSAIIRTPYDEEVIMIDTGGKLEFVKEDWQIKEKKYHISNNTLTFLKSIGITRINHLLLTHGDDDHIGETMNILKKFKIKNIIMNNGNLNENEWEIINNANNISIKQNTIDSKLKIEFLNNRDFHDENDNSLVLFLKLYDYSFLFMGDASKKTEKNINVSADFIKLGHHGSRTSSDESFLKRVNPRVAIISSGKNNRYNHPSIETIETLNKLNINYMNTQDRGTIIIKINKETHNFSFNPP